jgi:hypothetical protein
MPADFSESDLAVATEDADQQQAGDHGRRAQGRQKRLLPEKHRKPAKGHHGTSRAAAAVRSGCGHWRCA